MVRVERWYGGVPAAATKLLLLPLVVCRHAKASSRHHADDLLEWQIFCYRDPFLHQNKARTPLSLNGTALSRVTQSRHRYTHDTSLSICGFAICRVQKFAW